MNVRFGEHTLDSDSRLLRRGGEPLHLSRKAFDALCVLLERRPGAVGKDELHARLWPGTYVVDANLSVVIAEIRRVLGDDPHAPRFIRTVHRIGYAFCAEASGDTVRRVSEARAWFLWNDRALALETGENVLGRDPSCRLWVDASGVSRRHAAVRVQDSTITIEDLGSKNGTFVGGVAVTGRRAIGDGDRIRLGSVELELRTAAGSETETVRISRER
jgi:DNA-binding winged helix-turn-helix (wHTH) protein